MLDLLPDLCDEFPNEIALVQQQWRSFGTKRIFYGEVVTVKCHEDNSLVKEQLAQPGQGKVLVVDGGGSMRRALLGDLIAESAVKNGWEGVIIYGCIRDAGTINTLNIGVKALGTNPIKTEKRGLGDLNIALELPGVVVNPGYFVYADENGVLFSEKQLVSG